ncbi:CCR4-NOT core subunit CDC39 [Lipomyces japonicus]|uniref:CCR4-NOT core subunit CDC39 n=1 Tax=Lipomyces japonicus TaxID=56871 RepID=UPI0034CE6FBF
MSRPPDNPGIRRLLAEEVRYLSVNPQLSYKFADSVFTTDNDAFKGFKLQPFFDSFNLDDLQRTILSLSLVNSPNQDFKNQASEVLANSFISFLNILGDPVQYANVLTDDKVAEILKQYTSEIVPQFFTLYNKYDLAVAARNRYETVPQAVAEVVEEIENSFRNKESLPNLIQYFVSTHSHDNNLIVKIGTIVSKLGLLDEFIFIKSYFFVLDLLTTVSRLGQLRIEEPLKKLLEKDGQDFALGIIDFLDTKSSSEYAFQQQLQQRQQDPSITVEKASTTTLHVQDVFLLLKLLVTQNIPNEAVGRWQNVQAQCIQTYPRLINFGRGHDAAILTNSAQNSFASEVEKQMKFYYQKMYEQETTISEVIGLLQRLRVSDDPSEQDIFACMVHSLFDEYRFFPDYPLSALATTAVLFGSIIQFHIVEEIPLSIALRFVLEALKQPPDAKMFKFGLQALMQFQQRLQSFPQYCGLLLQIPSLESVQPQLIAKLRECVSKPELDTNTNGSEPPPPPAFRALHLDLISLSDEEEPNENLKDKALFLVNNLAQSNVEPKSRELRTILEDRYHHWFAKYLVESRAKLEPNYHNLYIQMLEVISNVHLNRQVLYITYSSIISLLNSNETIGSSSERGRLKNLAGWLGLLTIARDKPIKHKNISFKDLLIEGFDSSRLIVVLPFTCKVLEQAGLSRVFRPPNPWLIGILKLMVELYQFADLKLNLKFEIEVLCKNLKLEIDTIQPSSIIRDRPPKNELIDGLGLNQDLDRLSLNYNRASSRTGLRPGDVLNESSGFFVQEVAGTTIFASHANLKKILLLAIERSVKEILGPVVERSDTIAQIATKELITKDFALEGDEKKMRSAAHNMVHQLASSLALVTCKEPLRLNIANTLRTLLASNGYAESMFTPEIFNTAVNDQLDNACAVVQKAAVEKASLDIDQQLAPAYQLRQRHREVRPGQSFVDPQASRYAMSLPDPFRLKPGGLSRQQQTVYEDFGKFKLGTSTAELFTLADMDPQLTALLQAPPPPPGAQQQPLLPQLTASQRHALLQGQQQRVGLPGVLTQQQADILAQQQPGSGPVVAQGQSPAFAQPDLARGIKGAENSLNSVNALVDSFLALTKDASETSIDQLSADHRIKLSIANILNAVNRHPLRDSMILRTSQITVSMLFTSAETQLQREVLAYLLARLCDLSTGTAKEVVLWLIHSDDERKFNVQVMITLMKIGLIHPQELDLTLSKQLQTGRSSVVQFAASLIHDAVVRQPPCALRTDFTGCIETLEALAAAPTEDPTAQQVLESLSVIEPVAFAATSDVASMKDQVKYIFAEWVRLTQHPASNDKMLYSFIYQMSAHGLLDEDKYLGLFFRSAIEFCTDAYEKEYVTRLGQPQIALLPKESFIAIDALARLVIILVRVHEDGDQTKKMQYLRGVLSVFCLVFAHSHETEQESFNGQPFFRLFSSILCEWIEIEELQSASHRQEFYVILADVFKALQPLAFPGFTFSWMTLISHRMFMPKILKVDNKTSAPVNEASSVNSGSGWPVFVELLEALLKFIGSHLVGHEIEDKIKHAYKGTLRITLVLLHDFPEFLARYHYRLCNAVPISCIQLRNLILSAFPQNMTLPDPFAPGFKVDRLSEIRQDPVISLDDAATDLQKLGLKKFVDAYLKSAATTTAGAPSLKGLVKELIIKPRTEMGLGFDKVTTNVLALNAMVLYVGMQAVAEAKAAPDAAVFNAKSAHVTFLTNLILELNPEGRFFFLTAVTNQLRYPNSHTYYFSSLLLHLFGSAPQEQQDIQEHIARVLLERLICHRPHPWGLLITFSELDLPSNFGFFDVFRTAAASGAGSAGAVRGVE